MIKTKYLLLLITICLSISFLFAYYLKSIPKTQESNFSSVIVSDLPKAKDIHILFGGDLMLDRSIRSIANKNGYDYILSNLTDFFINKDLVVLNLEGPITSNKSVSINSKIGSTSNYIFTFEPIVTDTLLRNNIKLVNIGNNHMLNMGISGLAETKDNLFKNDISYFGNIDMGESYVYKTDIDGIELSFINYNEFINDGLTTTMDQIEKANETDFIIVYAHWGQEYVKTATMNQVSLAHQFIDAGADLVIGTHPHVIQNSEVYKDKYIYYSLGNFVFDQYFSPDTKKGLLVDMIINTSNPNLPIYEEYYVDMKPNGQSVLIQN